MDSLGDKIRKHREEKGYSLDQAARDTHIAKKFLEAIETEAYNTLPGESYVIGFLRNYSEYLGMNTDEILVMYKNMRLQEQPPPMEELLVKQGVSSKYKALIIGIIIAVVLIAGIIIVSNSKNTDKKTKEDTVPISIKDSVVFDGKVLIKTFEVGSKISIPFNDATHEMQIIYGDSKLGINLDGQFIALSSEKTELLDLTKDKKPDLRITIGKPDTRYNPTRILVRLDREVESGVANAILTDIPEPSAVAQGDQYTGTPSFSDRVKKEIVLLEAEQKTPISGILSIRGASYVRVENDKGKIIERNFSRGEEISVEGDSWVRLLSMDGSRGVLVISGKEQVLGASAEVSTWLLKWVGPENGKFKLTLVPVY